MMIQVTGTLTDPMGQFLPNKQIRITDQVLGINTLFTTDAKGKYNFHLNEGTYHLEVLNLNEYNLAGELVVDQATPSLITIEELLVYSEPVKINPFYPSAIVTAVKELASSITTRFRIWREQVRDTLVSVVDYKETMFNKVSNTRNGTKYSEVSACGASISKTDNAFSNEAINIASTGYQIKSGSNTASCTKELGTEYIDTHVVTIGSQGIHESIHMDTDRYASNKTNPTETITVSQVGSTKSKHTAIGNVTTSVEVTEDTSEVIDTIGLITRKSSHKASESIIETTAPNYADKTVNANRRITAESLKINTHKDVDVLDVTGSKVTINGTLQINKLLDEDGNEIKPGENGDTIYQVSQYAETPNGPWHDEILVDDEWKRDNLSVNGVVDPTKWSIAYRFKGHDGNVGDTIVVEYEYSPDGYGQWTPIMKTGDKYRRERIVINGVAGPWSDPARIAGTDGTTVEVRFEYSIDGIHNWHATLQPSDKFERRATFENGVQVTPWSDPYPIGRGSDAVQLVTQFVFKRSNTKPATPTGGSYGNPIPSGWFDGIPAGEAIVWMSVRRFAEDPDDPHQEANWTTPSQLTDTATVDYEFSTVLNNPGNPTSHPGNWSNTATPETVWMAVRTKKNGEWGSWSIARIKGEDGVPSLTSFVYKRSTGQPPKPTGGSFNSPVPSGWSDGIPVGELTVWMSVRIFTKDGSVPQEPEWSNPARLTSTANIQYKFSSHATNVGTPTTQPSKWADRPDANTIWQAIRKNIDGVWDDWDVYKVKGETGADGKPGIAGQPGANGKPGSGWYSYISNGGNWPGDTVATADFIRVNGRSPQENDHWFYVDKYPNPRKSSGKRCNSKEGQPITWSTPALAVNGDMLVDGCVSARNIVADSITGNHISASSTILAGSGSWTAGMNGNDNHPSSFTYYNGWRFWSGASNPNNAPFRVDMNGKLYSSNANITGSVFTGTVNADAGYFSGELRVGGGEGGSKLRIYGDRIEVWDNGSLRVRMGRL